MLDVETEVKDMDIKVSIAKPEMIEGIWPSIYPHLEPAIDEDFWTDEQTLKKLLMDDHALLFFVTVDGQIKGAAVTQIEEVRNRVVNIVTLGGIDFMEWKNDLNIALTFYAARMRCTKIVALGRKGWEKFWPDFKPGKILFCKEIAQ